MIVLVASVFAAPPAQNPFKTNTENILDIVVPKFEYNKFGDSFTFHTHVYNATLYLMNDSLVDCNLHLYNETGNHILKQDLTWSSPEFELKLNTSILYYKGRYGYLVYCNHSNGQGGFYSDSFVVNTDGEEKNFNDSTLAAVFTLLPLIFVLLLIFASMGMGEEHNTIKFTAFLLIPIAFFVSLHFGLISVVRFYDIDALAENIGTTAYWAGWIAAVFITYVLIYLFYKVTKQIATEKEEKLEY